MKIFHLELADDLIADILEAAEDAYPSEVCGVVLGGPKTSQLERVAVLRNVQDRYHSADPVRFPRTSRDAFRVDELERMRLLESAEAEGLVERIFFHSHPDAGAYFSPEDRAAAVHEGEALMPGVVQLVVSVMLGVRQDVGAFLYEEGHFREVRVPILPSSGSPFPSMADRLMGGGEAQRPIVPVGPGLWPRAVTEAEWARLTSTLGQVVEVNAATRDAIARLAAGTLSPLEGFMDRAELTSVRTDQRLCRGVPWLAPLMLTTAAEVDAAADPIGLAYEGRLCATMAVHDHWTAKSGETVLGGPVFAPPSMGLDAPTVRSALLSLGAKRVLAAPPDRTVEGSFDVRLGEPGAPPYLGALGDGSWWDAVIAQNLGATHTWVHSETVAQAVEETLCVEPVRTSAKR